MDFKRRKDGVPARVAAIEYDPNRSAHIALLHYADGEKAYILAPARLRIGGTVVSGPAGDPARHCLRCAASRHHKINKWSSSQPRRELGRSPAAYS